MKAMKFDVSVSSGLLSSSVQEALALAGYTWWDKYPIVRNQFGKYLYTSARGQITYGTHVSAFTANDAEEYTLSPSGDLIPKQTPAPATKLVDHDGITYEVPSWAKYLTRDGATCYDTRVWAWEEEPVWKLSGCYVRSVGMCEIVKPYTPPKPEGHFFKEI